jgi:anti-anti-sigma factor
MGMKIRMKKHGDVPVIQVEGEAVGRDVVKLSKKLEDCLVDNAPVVAVDLSKTDIIDSYGLGVLIFSWKQFSSRNKKLVFVSPQGFVRNLFEGTNLTKVIGLIDSIEKL